MESDDEAFLLPGPHSDTLGGVKIVVLIFLPSDLYHIEIINCEILFLTFRQSLL